MVWGIESGGGMVVWAGYGVGRQQLIDIIELYIMLWLIFDLKTAVFDSKMDCLRENFRP